MRATAPRIGLKPRMFLQRLVLIGGALAAAAACDRRATGDSLRVVVSVAPLVGLAAALAPEDAVVSTLVPAGRSLHGYEMTPSDVARLGGADVIVHIGLGLDPAVGGFIESHPSRSRREVSFARVLGLNPAPGSDSPHLDHSHDQDQDQEHDHDQNAHGPSAVDQHLWLDPSLVALLAPALRRAIEEAMAARGLLTDAEKARLTAAEADLLARIAEVDREYSERLAPLKGRAIVTHHDAFRRVADRYGLEIAAVIRPIESAESTPGAIAAAAAAVRDRGAKAVFFEPQFDSAAAQRIAAAAGARLGRLDPEGDTDWFRLMRTNLDSLVSNLSDFPSPPPSDPPQAK